MQSTVTLLPYLIFKNHGSLLLSHLKEEISTTPPDAVRDVLGQALIEFSTALGYDSDDPVLWRKVARIGDVFDLPKISRFAVESILHGSEQSSRGLLWSEEPKDSLLAKHRLTSVLWELRDDLTLRALESMEHELDVVEEVDEWLSKEQLRLPRTAWTQQECQFTTLRPTNRSWYAIGRSLAEAYRVLDQQLFSTPLYLSLDLPEPTGSLELEVEDETDAEIEEQRGPKTPMSARPVYGTNMAILSAPPYRQQSPVILEDHKPNESRSTTSPGASPSAGTPTAKHVVTPDTEVVEVSPNVREPTAAPASPRPNKRVRDEHDEASDEEDITNVRASKRVKQRNDDPTQAHGSTLFETLRGFETETIRFESLFALDPSEITMSSEEYDNADATLDFKLWLYNDWDDGIIQLNNIAPRNSVRPSFSRTMMLAFPSKAPFITEDKQDDTLQLFTDRFASQHVYYSQFTIDYVLGLTSGPNAWYLSSVWSANLRQIVLKFVSPVEHELLEGLLRDNVESFHVYVAQAVVELVLDEYITAERQRIDSPVNMIDTSLYDKLCRWQNCVRMLLLKFENISPSITIRHLWSCALFAQARDQPAEEIVNSYKSIRPVLQAQDAMAIVLPNSQAMPLLSAERLEAEIAKFSTIDFFNEVFESRNSLDHEAVLTHLKPVLLQSDDESPRDQMIDDHLKQTSIEFRLDLWLMLSKAFESQKEQSEATFASYMALKLLIESLQTEEYLAQALDSRQTMLIQTLSQASQIVKSCFDTSAQFEFYQAWSVQRVGEAAQGLISFMTLLQVFALYEDAAAEDEMYARKSITFYRYRDRLRTDLVRSWMLLYYCLRALSEKTIEDEDMLGHKLATLISAIHDELGTRGYCGLAKGVLLETFENELFRLNRAETETDMIQILHCKYDLSYVCGIFTPWDHYAEPKTPTKEQALRILPFITTFLIEKTPGVLLPKQDLKRALNTIHEVTWGAMAEEPSFMKRQVIIDDYLDQDLSPHDAKRSIMGHLCFPSLVELRPSPEHSAAYHELSYTMGIIHLSQYRNRNKSLNKGLSDLEEAQTYFMLDLAYNSRRFKSWRALAFINAALADNELSWDAQHIVDASGTINRFRRRSLICYMTAVSLLIQELRLKGKPNDEEELLFSDTLHSFGLQIYTSARAPLEMQAFQRTQSRYIERGLNRPVEELLSSLTLVEALRLAARCFNRAKLKCSERWRCYLMLGKTHEKLSISPDVVMQDYGVAIELAPQNHAEQGLLLEPHYRLLSSTYKFLIKDKITPEDAVNYMSRSPLTKRHIPDITTRESVITALQASINGLRNADKKHWQHRPVNRLAKIAGELPRLGITLPADYDGTKEARAEVETLFTAKGSASNLLNIWRPEFERPGRHFVYTQRYTAFYIDILFTQRDMEAIKNLMRRMRKAMQNVLHHKDLWDFMCARYLAFNLTEYNIRSADLTKFIDVVETSQFSEIASILEAQDLENTTLALLRDFYDVRKLNGGLYETNKIDDAIIDCYLMLYDSIPVPEPVPVISDSVPAIPEAPWLSNPLKPKKTKEQKITKIARKDILSKAFSLCKPRDKKRRESEDRDGEVMPDQKGTEHNASQAGDDPRDAAATIQQLAELREAVQDLEGDVDMATNSPTDLVNQPAGETNHSKEHTHDVETVVDEAHAEDVDMAEEVRKSEAQPDQMDTLIDISSQQGDGLDLDRTTKQRVLGTPLEDQVNEVRSLVHFPSTAPETGEASNENAQSIPKTVDVIEADPDGKVTEIDGEGHGERPLTCP